MGSRKTGAENVYEAARKWVDCALKDDGSLFTPGKAIWSLQLLKRLREMFLDSPDVGDGNFFTVLEKQLEGGAPQVYQLMGEALYAHFLIIWKDAMKPDTKKNNVERVLGWGAPVKAIPDGLVGGLTPGIARPGIAFSTWRRAQVGCLIEFVEQWKEKKSSDRDRLLRDPWMFKDFLMGVRFNNLLLRDMQDTPRVQKEALLHLVHPDTFEGTVSINLKWEIANADAFTHFVTDGETDVDRKLMQIRQGLENELGRDFDFHDHDIKRRWDSKTVRNGPSTGSTETNKDPMPQNLCELAEEVYLPVSFLEEIKTLLEDKKQVIFQGPPGTGKTYIAQALAEHLAGSKGRVTLVQFHPSYAYEDFVQGFRPAPMKDGQPGFHLKNGPLLEIAKRAEEDSNNDYYLIIDEINRGSIAKVFGELYFLLEYRDKPMNLQYSDVPFSLPSNLYIIGTMNTADRNIALVDLALRRRFYFVEFHPDEEPVKGVLRRWLERNELDHVAWVADVVDRANARLEDDRHAAIGPSYFMRADLDEATVERIWKHGVLPYIEERRFGGEQATNEFELDKLRQRVPPTASQEASDGQLHTGEEESVGGSAE